MWMIWVLLLSQVGQWGGIVEYNAWTWFVVVGYLLIMCTVSRLQGCSTQLSKMPRMGRVRPKLRYYIGVALRGSHYILAYHNSQECVLAANNVYLL